MTTYPLLEISSPRIIFMYSVPLLRMRYGVDTVECLATTLLQGITNGFQLYNSAQPDLFSWKSVPANGLAIWHFTQFSFDLAPITDFMVVRSRSTTTHPHLTTATRSVGPLDCSATSTSVKLSPLNRPLPMRMQIKLRDTSHTSGV